MFHYYQQLLQCTQTLFLSMLLSGCTWLFNLWQGLTFVISFYIFQTPFDTFLYSDNDVFCKRISFEFTNNLPRPVLRRIISRCLEFHKPVHIWKDGVIINENVVALKIAQPGIYSYIFQVYIFSIGHISVKLWKVFLGTGVKKCVIADLEKIMFMDF